MIYVSCDCLKCINIKVVVLCLIESITTNSRYRSNKNGIIY